ncbi:hypothetical protein [Dyadobacter sp. CY312]|uniref:hypothetical protein n=1 Tax=Dyadobacter sp. CY312 TaxID=2907303 RepID=UPI001F2F8125|nr:hypothetical protein [Dyadobacter sp. CY312]MCE7039237.1 hypothetical protein [Dyadobacter sp. CY312]
MLNVSEGINVGTEHDCRSVVDGNFAVIHACKIPCHCAGVGYTGNLDKDHPEYLVSEKDNHLYLNIIDAAFPLSPKFGDPMFRAAFRFLEKSSKTKEVLIHCNQGHSRGPSIALAYMAKMDLIENQTYAAATEDFKKIYPDYEPGKGVVHYLENNWNAVMQL